MLKQFVNVCTFLIATSLFTACSECSFFNSTKSYEIPVVTEENGVGFKLVTTPVPETSPQRNWWMPRFQEKQNEANQKKDDIKIVFIGDSITHFWENAGKQIFNDNYAKYNTLNLGFAGDRTQHTLWVIEQGGIFGKIHPKLIVLMIGTNNLGAHESDPKTAAEGIRRCVASMHRLNPDAKILLFGVFPRGANENDPFRAQIKEINSIICHFADNKTVFYEDLYSKFLTSDGVLERRIMNDLLHPTAEGYKIWADAINPYVERFVK